MPASPSTVLLFSYGTLQNRNVQIVNFGRELSGRADALPGYKRTLLAVTDPTVQALSGQPYLATLEPTSNSEDSVSGVVFEITEAELAAADQYETNAAYRRISVTLQSGKRAWAYVR